MSAVPPLDLTPEDRADFENRAWALRAQFRESKEHARVQRWEPDRPVSFELNEGHIKGVVWGFRLDEDSRHIEHISAHTLKGAYAFELDGVRALDELAERWATHCSFAGLTTTDAMRWRLLRWVAAEVESQVPLSCVDRVLDEFNKEVGPHEIWVQISGIDVESPFPMGELVLRGVDATQIDHWARTQCRDPSDAAQLEALRAHYAKHWQGKTAAVYTGIADEGAAQAAAIEHAERACSLLRVLGPGVSNPTSRSFVQPISFFWQHRMREVLLDPNVRGGKIVAEPVRLEPPSYGIPKSSLAALWKEGLFGHAHDLLSTRTPSAFQQRLLASLLIYARQRLTNDPVEKMIFTISGMETLLYADSPKPRQPDLKRRLCGLLARSNERHDELFRLVGAGFQLRNGFLHHGHPINDLRAVESFLDVASLFFRTLLIHQRRWATAADFCAAMDAHYESTFGSLPSGRTH